MSDVLTPISETSTESEFRDLRPRPLNFSRPRPIHSAQSNEKLFHDRSDSAAAVAAPRNGSVRGIQAFHDSPQSDLPSEPRFSLDSTDTDTSNSAASEFAWDGLAGELRSRRRPDVYERNQRFRKPSSSSGDGVGRPTTRSHRSGGRSQRPVVAELPGSVPAPPTPAKHPRITERTSDEQQGERMSTSSRGTWEDGAGHHTVSVDGEGGGMEKSDEGNGNSAWSSSDYDISGLSASEIRKLRKKGINPQLYAEMKAARKGKGKWIGPLVGNTFIG